MSNEFILVVSWKPTNRNGRMRRPEVWIAKVKVESRLASVKSLNSTYDVRLLPRSDTPLRLVILSHAGLNVVSKVSQIEPQIDSIKCSELSEASCFAVCKEFLVIISGPNLTIITNNKETEAIKSIPIIFDNISFGLSSWASTGKHVDSIGRRVYLTITKDSNSCTSKYNILVCYNLTPLLKDHSTDIRPAVINTDIKCFVCDKSMPWTNSYTVWSINRRGQLYKNDTFLPVVKSINPHTLTDTQVVYNCIVEADNWLIVSSSRANMNNFYELICKRTTKQVDSLSIEQEIPNAECNQMAIIKTPRYLLACSICIFDSVNILLINNAKLYVIIKDLKPIENGSQLYAVTGFIIDRKLAMFVVVGNNAAMTQISVKLP